MVGHDSASSDVHAVGSSFNLSLAAKPLAHTVDVPFKAAQSLNEHL